jgi:hypothetical protein
MTRGDQPVMAFGVMGGNMQPQGHPADRHAPCHRRAGIRRRRRAALADR